MMFKPCLLTIAAFVLAAPHAMAQTAAPAPAAPAPEKKICRSIVPTGSIMGKRICLTKTEWKEFDGINSRATETFRNRPGSSCGVPGSRMGCD